MNLGSGLFQGLFIIINCLRDLFIKIIAFAVSRDTKTETGVFRKPTPNKWHPVLIRYFRVRGIIAACPQKLYPSFIM